MKKNLWLYIALLLVVSFATFQAVKNMAATKAADVGEVHGLDAEGLEKVVKRADSGQERESTNVKAPSFTLKSLDGSEYVSIGGKRKKPVVLNFWASWCDACSLEAVELRKLHEQYKDRIDFYGINVTTEEQPENIKAFVTENELTYPILLDEHKRAADLYELHSLPTMFLIDEEGYVVDTFHMVDQLELAEKIGRLAGK
ncbi:TlpA family protein disulfide reductase [Peribacillus muralis]|uniref:TlpA family protein disulfide reductase n=1 Tax=Peribacillus muralis TaxID=264697 RepID=UPI00070FC19A|nr:TlpA disulfide reductase family protein [Peribacillus muralis]